MNAQEKRAEEIRQQSIREQGFSEEQRKLANQQIGAADQQRQRVQNTGDDLMGEADQQSAAQGVDASGYGNLRTGSANYLNDIENPLARGLGGYNANEASAIQDKGGLDGLYNPDAIAGLSDKAGLARLNDPSAVTASADFLKNYQMSPEEQQRIVTGAGITAGKGASAANEAVERQVAATGGNPLALGAYRARLERQRAGDSADAMTQARIGASDAAAKRAISGETLREEGGKTVFGQGLQTNQAGFNQGLAANQQGFNQGKTISDATSARAKDVGDMRLAQQKQGLDYYQGQNTQASANEEAAKNRQQTTAGQKASIYGTQTGGTNTATGLGTEAVNAGTSAVNAGTGAVNAQTGAANSALEASNKPGIFDKVLGAASGVLSKIPLADGTAGYLNDDDDAGMDAVVGENGPEAIVEAAASPVRHQTFMDNGGYPETEGSVDVAPAPGADDDMYSRMGAGNASALTSAGGRVGDTPKPGWLSRIGSTLKAAQSKPAQPSGIPASPAHKWNPVDTYTNFGSAVGSGLAKKFGADGIAMPSYSGAQAGQDQAWQSKSALDADNKTLQDFMPPPQAQAHHRGLKDYLAEGDYVSDSGAPLDNPQQSVPTGVSTGGSGTWGDTNGPNSGQPNPPQETVTADVPTGTSYGGSGTWGDVDGKPNSGQPNPPQETLNADVPTGVSTGGSGTWGDVDGQPNSGQPNPPQETLYSQVPTGTSYGGSGTWGDVNGQPNSGQPNPPQETLYSQVPTGTSYGGSGTWGDTNGPNSGQPNPPQETVTADPQPARATPPASAQPYRARQPQAAQTAQPNQGVQSQATPQSGVALADGGMAAPSSPGMVPPASRIRSLEDSMRGQGESEMRDRAGSQSMPGRADLEHNQMQKAAEDAMRLRQMPAPYRAMENAYSQREKSAPPAHGPGKAGSINSPRAPMADGGVASAMPSNVTINNDASSTDDSPWWKDLVTYAGKGVLNSILPGGGGGGGMLADGGTTPLVSYGTPSGSDYAGDYSPANDYTAANRHADHVVNEGNKGGYGQAALQAETWAARAHTPEYAGEMARMAAGSRYQQGHYKHDAALIRGAAERDRQKAAKAPAPMADGGMAAPPKIITSPTNVHLNQGDAVVPLSYRAKAKIRPSVAMAAMAPRMRQPYGGNRA